MTHSPPSFPDALREMAQRVERGEKLTAEDAALLRETADAIEIIGAKQTG